MVVDNKQLIIQKHRASSCGDSLTISKKIKDKITSMFSAPTQTGVYSPYTSPNQLKCSDT